MKLFEGKKPIVSIIMPVHNDENYLNESIGSVLKQSLQNFELLIVDDCSSDASYSIIRSFTDPRIKIFRNNKNMGAAAARNIALKNASGRYIAFLDADDIWAQDKLSKQIEFMISNNCSFTYTNYDVVNESGEYLYSMTGPGFVTQKMLIKRDYMGCLTVVYDSFVTGFLQVDERLKKRNDYAIWLQVIEKTKKCVLINEVLAKYRKQSNGISRNKGKLLFWHYRLFRWVLKYGVIRSAYHALLNAIYFLRKGKYKYVRN